MNWIVDKVEGRRVADARLHYAAWLFKQQVLAKKNVYVKNGFKGWEAKE